MSFIDKVEEFSSDFDKFLEESEKVRCISHLDADGLCSATLMTKLLSNKGVDYEVRIVKQLEKEVIEELREENNSTYILTDLGSGQLQNLKELMDKNRIAVIDHHQIKEDVEHENLLHLNPYHHEVDGSEDVSASTLTYLVTHFLGLEDHEYLAIVGSIGDRQYDKDGLNGTNKESLKRCESSVNVRKGIRVYGRGTKPIHEALARSDGLNIPGVSGDTSKAFQFLSELGIELKKEEGSWRTLDDLSTEEERKLISEIIVRTDHENPEDLVGKVYEIKECEGVFSNGREFSTFLNSCGRIGQGLKGIEIASNPQDGGGEEIIRKYKRKLGKGISWVEDNEEGIGQVRVVNGEGKIEDTLIGSICSILISSIEKDFIIGFAESNNGLKVSIRSKKDIEVNLGKIVERVVEEVGGEGGGHRNAAGAKIPKESKEEFLKLLSKKINQKKS